MKTITNNEILRLYKQCGLEVNITEIRTEINIGTLNNKLNANYSFLNQNSIRTICGSNTKYDLK